MPQSTIQIPDTIDEAVESLTGLGELILARKWERAAIVAAFVRLDLGHGGRDETSTSGRFESARDFAGRGIIGLSSTSSVTKYVQAWLDANDGKYPKPGSTRRLPKGTFPPMRTGTDGFKSPKGAADTVAEIVEQHGAAAVIEGMDPEQVQEVVEAAARKRPGATARTVDKVLDEISPPHPVPSEVFPGSSKAETRMDIDRDIANLHHQILLMDGHVKANPEIMRDHAPRLASEAEQLQMVAEMATGMSEAEMAKLLDGAS